jgi:hypothetical protein
MRPVLLLALAVSATAASADKPLLTIVLEFQGPHSNRSVAEMRREVETIMRDSCSAARSAVW